MSHPTDTSPPCVLVVGKRIGIVKALRRRKIPYALWRPVAMEKPDARAVAEIVAPFPATRQGVAAVLKRLNAETPFTHVIAGGEGAVIAASHARGCLGVRVTPHAVVERFHDKLHMKRALRAADVAVTDWLDLNAVRPEATAALGRPLVIKDRRSSGSRGVEILRGATPLPPRVGRNRIAERFVSGAEMSVESFVVDGRIVFVSTTNYHRPGFINVIPSGIDAEVAAAVHAINASALTALGVRNGMTHLEVFLTPDGPVVGEVGLRPPGGYIMDTLSLAWGFDAWDAFVAVEVSIDFAFPPVPACVAAAIILHPGPGTLVRIEGESDVRALSTLHTLKIKRKPGEVVAPRIGVGVDIGHVLLCEAERGKLLEAVAFVDHHLRFVREPV